MTSKIKKLANYFTKKYSNTEEDIYYDIGRTKGETEEDIYWELLEDQRRQNPLEDILGLVDVARQVWNKRNDIKSSATNKQDEQKVVKLLQRILGVSSELASRARNTGLNKNEAAKFKSDLLNSVNALQQINGMQDWSGWIGPLKNSINYYQPRKIVSHRALRQRAQEIAQQRARKSRQQTEEQAPQLEEDIPIDHLFEKDLFEDTPSKKYTLYGVDVTEDGPSRISLVPSKGTP